MVASSNKLDPVSAFLKGVLPRGVSVEEFYIGLSVCMLVICGMIIKTTVGRKHNPMSNRIKAIHERRKEMYSGLLSNTKKRNKPEGSINFMRKVSLKFQLVKKLELEQSELLLVQAGFRSKDAVSIFAFITMALPLILGSIGFVVLKMSVMDTLKAKAVAVLWPIAGLYFGLKFPGMVIKHCTISI